jgi:tRNA-modifying protein YgfZ
VEIELEAHDLYLLLGPAAAPPGGTVAVANADYGVPGFEVIDGPEPADAEQLSADDLEALRIQAGTPVYGREIDDRVLPAEAGLVERAVSLTKGCYPGQEPIARLHYRGHANRGLRVLGLDSGELPEYDAEVRVGGKPVGRITSAARFDGGVVALAYVRTEVPPDAELAVGSARARPLH